MSGRYLTDLAAVLRAWGVTVEEDAGWQTRARSSGGYASGRPTHVMIHHTASSTSPANDIAYIARNADAAPLANLYLARDGTVTVIAAGCTNTNGSGHDSWGGGVPDDSMNTYAIGIEAANNGVGESWPQVQTDAYLAVVRALCVSYSIPFDHCRAHAEWAPGRKVDAAGPPRWATGAATWRMDDFRLDAAIPAPLPPDPPAQEDDVTIYVFESQTTPREFNAMFFGTGDGEARTIELQWSGDGDDPRVAARVQTMLENFGPPRPLLLAGIRNNRLAAPHHPEDIRDSLHTWTAADFAP